MIHVLNFDEYETLGERSKNGRKIFLLETQSIKRDKIKACFVVVNLTCRLLYGRLVLPLNLTVPMVIVFMIPQSLIKPINIVRVRYQSLLMPSILHYVFTSFLLCVGRGEIYVSAFFSYNIKYSWSLPTITMSHTECS